MTTKTDTSNIAGVELQGLSVEDRIANLEQEVLHLRGQAPRADKATLLIFSSDLDKVLAGLVIATTAASMGMEVTVFFTFWGLNVLKEKRVYQGKAVMERMIDLMTPTGPGHMGVSRMNMGGAGAVMLKHMMKGKNVMSGDEFLALAKESGVRLIACSMSMDVMGIRKEELTDGIDVGGAAAYLGEAARSGVTLFI
jgi:peroxiredoxin family protein